MVTNKNIDALISDFHVSAGESQKLLSVMLSVISDGKVPEKENVDELDLSINTLREKYDSISEYVSSQIPAEEMPKEGCSVAEFASALENSRAVHYRKQLEEVRATLERFISVRSLLEAFSLALQPYQEKAAQLLEKINSAETVDLESVEHENAGPAAFIEALNCGDADSQENIETLEHVLEYYPSRVYTGLLTKKYYIDNDAAVTLKNGETEDSREEAADKSAAADEGKSVSPAEGNTQEEHSAGNEDSGSEESRSDFVTALYANGAFIKEDENIGLLTTDVKQAEEKKVSSSIALNDFRRGSKTAAKRIIIAMDKYTCVSEDVLTAEGMSPQVARVALAELHKRGYLRKYGLAPAVGNFYCISPRLVKATEYKDVKRFLNMRPSETFSIGEEIPDAETSAAARIAYVNLLSMALCEVLLGWKALRYSVTTSLSTDSFCFKTFDAILTERCITCVGAFWKDTGFCDLDFKDWERIIWDSEGEPGIIVVAGIDADRAHAVAEAYAETTRHDISETHIILYSLSDKEYYDYETMEVLDEEDSYMLADNDPAEKDGPADTAEEDKKPDKEAVRDIVEEETAEDVKEDPEPASAVPEESVPDAEGAPEEDKKKEKGRVVPEETVRNSIYPMLADRKFYAAAAYTRAASAIDKDNEALYSLVSYAVNDPAAHCVYSTGNAFDLIARRGAFDDAMVAAVAARTFFSNQVRYDYQIKPFYNGIKEYPVLSRFPSVGSALYSMMEFKDEYKKGMGTYASYRAKSQAQMEKEIARVRNDAEIFYNNFVIGKKRESAKHERFLETKRQVFNVNGDIGVYIKSVVDGDREMVPLMTNFLQTEFLNSDDNISEDSINSEKLWRYIVRFWEKAGEKMVYRRHENLMSSLKSNITNLTLKAVQLLVRWCVLMEQAASRKEDEGSISYKRKRGKLLKDLQKGAEEISEACGGEIPEDEKAGLRVLENTLDTIRRCIDGTYDEYGRKYFYAPFLLTDDVILDEEFHPDLDMHGADLAAIDPLQRIPAHLEKLRCAESTYADRLKEILEQKGDDYGTARQIVEYMADTQPEFDAGELEETIDTGVSYARDAAIVKKNDFIGELELAQSYGQIDNSEEDKKEKILQVVDKWYGWAEETSNYGFFRKIMESYLAEIREKAKEREADLLEQLEAFKTAKISGLTAEAREKRIRRIREMIKEQNYTVAEVLLARTAADEDEKENIIEEDFLKEFLYNYDDYYKPVATHKSSFTSLVSARTRNKEEKGAKRLADNWLPGGSRLGIERLNGLLEGMGFNVGSVKSGPAGGKFETYIVKTAAPAKGQPENYTHPIAAFGSGASRDGFRVVCINGGYDADGLIDIMKQIGNAKHTLILQDHALSLSERRRLARKSKNALGDKFFGVVDRTVMMFLVRNYDETKINRMLVSLIMPFGYYQPYVWDSANVMPAEIFMGRKIELEKIKSPTGVNIVYGGRQLGKSALLKKAKEDVDHDENGDRAVYIDIKGLNYKEAANKVGHELYDQHILSKDINTTDWSELARMIKRRLQDRENEIPYLLLLLDEADTFIESCGSVNYKPMDALKEVQSAGVNRFKFVIAGLRNVVRFKRELALGNNSVLTHLESMTVKPFNTADARELMEVPLHYLGLRFPKAKESLITLILANTNYFPGLIQMYCAKLLEAMRNKDYAGYNETDAPVYEVSEAHIKKVLADPEFMRQIREKYVITLKLDEDNYYYLIALIMAYLYHRNGYNDGYSAEDILSAGKELDIGKISELSVPKLSAFMEELNELNVLRSIDDTRYLFTRFTFFQMMGTAAEVEDKLVEYMEG